MRNAVIMEHGTGHGVPAIQAMEGRIVPKMLERFATIMEHGAGQVVTVIRVGAGVIVPNAVGMDIGINGKITVPAGVPVMTAGVAAIALSTDEKTIAVITAPGL